MRTPFKTWLPLVLIASSAMAKVGVFDDEPAATLLIPYVEVDLASPTGRTTVVQVRATEATATLTHVTLWTDQGVPVLGFDLYLTGFDTLTFDVRDVLNGTLPATASAGQDPGDTISKHGANSQDINFASCTGVLPPAPLSATVSAGVRNAMTGLSSTTLQGKCGGRALGDNVARGFITIDNTNQCTQLNPTQPGYFATGGAGVAINRNSLTGHFSLVDRAAKTTRTFSAAHLQATSTGPYVTGSTAYTFYSRLIGSNADQREPLATAWSVPYRAGASVLAWRDVNWPAATYDCGQGPAPVGQFALFLFDQQELATDVSSLSPFPVMSARVRIGSSELPDTNRAGFVSFGGSVSIGAPRQAWLGSLEAAEAGEFTVGLVGTALDNAVVANAAYSGSPVSADFPPTVMGTMDRMPGSTLLLPYFEVDLDDPNRSNTVVRFGTASASAVLVNVTLWTDLGVPTRSFPLYLTGYDQAELDLRLLFAAGSFHRSASAGQDPTDTISPRSVFSQDINYASCTGRLPMARLKTDELASLVAAHTGQPVPSLQGKCAGSAQSDRVARGYVTIDQVSSCPTVAANAPNYTDALEYRNLLIGDWSITNRVQKTMYGEALVSLQARQPNHPFFQGGAATFYGRTRGWTGVDRREPLATQWEVPFDDTGAGKTSVVVWREPDVSAAPFTCGMTPPGQPGALGSAVAFDDQETVSTITGSPFTRVSSLTAVGAGGLDVPWSRGVLQFDFSGGTGGPTSDPSRRGGVVLAVRRDATDGTGWVQNGHPLVIDDLLPARALIEVSPGEGFVKGTATATFRVRLSQTPSAPVVVTFSSSNNLTFNPPSVTLTSASLTGATVTVTAGVNSCIAPPNSELYITTNATSADATFNAFDPNDTWVVCQP